MKKEKIFLTDQKQGALTTTSANHIANMAKEYVNSLQTQIDSINFVSTNVMLLSGGIVHELSHGMELESISTIKTNLNKIAEANSLIAWLREGIKAKESLTDDYTYHFTMDQWAKLNNEVIPNSPILTEVTEDDVIARMNIKERNEYYMLETICAVYGKAIHEKGPINNARKNLTKYIQNPSRVEGSGRDAVIYDYTPSVSETVVDEMFFDLQKIHRENQARLNSIKQKIADTVYSENLEIRTKFNAERDAYDDKITSIRAKYDLAVKEELNRISKLKIIIPDSLRNIYETVSKL